jgi:hypothetical protein
MGVWIPYGCLDSSGFLMSLWVSGFLWIPLMSLWVSGFLWIPLMSGFLDSGFLMSLWVSGFPGFPLDSFWIPLQRSDYDKEYNLGFEQEVALPKRRSD